MFILHLFNVFCYCCVLKESCEKEKNSAISNECTFSKAKTQTVFLSVDSFAIEAKIATSKIALFLTEFLDQCICIYQLKFAVEYYYHDYC